MNSAESGTHGVSFVRTRVFGENNHDATCHVHASARCNPPFAFSPMAWGLRPVPHCRQRRELSMTKHSSIDAAGLDEKMFRWVGPPRDSLSQTCLEGSRHE